MLTLAGPAVLVNTALLGLTVKYVLPYGWDWDMSLLFGSMLRSVRLCTHITCCYRGQRHYSLRYVGLGMCPSLSARPSVYTTHTCTHSATDPVAVVALLKELGVAESLSILIEVRVCPLTLYPRFVGDTYLT